MRCGWWNRWLHRRNRDADVLFLLPAIALRAEMEGGDVDARIDAAFALHAALPGQEHWRCECALAESPLAVDAVARPASSQHEPTTRD